MHPVKSSAKPGAGFIEVSDIAIFNQRLDIHGNLRQVEVRTNSHSRCNTGFLQDMPRLRPRRRWMPSDANNPILMFRGWELYIKCEQEPMREMLCSRWFLRQHPI